MGAVVLKQDCDSQSRAFRGRAFPFRVSLPRWHHPLSRIRRSSEFRYYGHNVSINRHNIRAPGPYHLERRTGSGLAFSLENAILSRAVLRIFYDASVSDTSYVGQPRRQIENE